MGDRASRIIPEEWGRTYQEQHPLYERWAEALAALVTQLLAAHGLKVDHIEHRAKDVASLVRRVKHRVPPQDLASIPDLAGVRVVVHYANDKASAWKILADALSPLLRMSHQNRAQAEPDRFGYSSDHLVVKLDRRRAALPEWHDYQKLIAEIQIRTVLEHAWAVVSHDLVYKANFPIPAELRRKINATSAILEQQDGGFVALRRERDQASADMLSTVSTGDLSEIAIDEFSLWALLESRELCSTFQVAAESAGFQRLPYSAGPTDELEILAKSCDMAGLTHLDEVWSALERLQPAADGVLIELAHKGRESEWRPWAHPTHVLALLLLSDANATAQQVRACGFRAECADTFDGLRVAGETG